MASDHGRPIITSASIGEHHGREFPLSISLFEEEHGPGNPTPHSFVLTEQAARWIVIYLGSSLVSLQHRRGEAPE